MSSVELVSLIASIASLILAIGAIWLSIVFYKMSSEASKATTEAAKGIDASVKRLENLFDKLYSDTFSMMRDTVSDMRKHIWSVNDDDTEINNKNQILEEADKKAEAKLLVIKSNLEKQLNEILERQQIADGKVLDLNKELEGLLSSAIETSRTVESEAREETIRNHILLAIKKLQKHKKIIIAGELVSTINENISTHKIIDEIQRMKDDKLIYFDGDNLTPESRIVLLD